MKETIKKFLITLSIIALLFAKWAGIGTLSYVYATTTTETTRPVPPKGGVNFNNGERPPMPREGLATPSDAFKPNGEPPKVGQNINGEKPPIPPQGLATPSDAFKPNGEPPKDGQNKNNGERPALPPDDKLPNKSDPIS